MKKILPNIGSKKTCFPHPHSENIPFFIAFIGTVAAHLILIMHSKDTKQATIKRSCIAANCYGTDELAHRWNWQDFKVLFWDVCLLSFLPVPDIDENQIARFTQPLLNYYIVNIIIKMA